MIHIDYILTTDDGTESLRKAYASTPVDAAYMQRIISSASNLQETGHGGPSAQCDELRAIRQVNL